MKLMIEFTNDALSFYIAKKESLFYTIKHHSTIPLSTTTTELADGTIYNPTRVKEYLSRTIKDLRITKPKTIFFVPDLQKASADIKSLQILQLALCSFNVPLSLEYILPLTLKSLITLTNNQMHIPRPLFKEVLKTDLLHLFKPHHRNTPISYLLLAGSSILILVAIIIIASHRISSCRTASQVTINNLEVQYKELQEKVTPLKKHIKKTKKLIKHNIDHETLQKNNNLIQALFHKIEQAIPDDTYLNSITIAPAQTPQAPLKKANPSKRNNPLTASKTLSIKGCSALPSSTMKFFTNLEDNQHLEDVSISSLEQNPINSTYQFTLLATLKNLTS